MRSEKSGMKKRWLIAAGMAVCILALAACGSAGADGEAYSGAADGAESPGTSEDGVISPETAASGEETPEEAAVEDDIKHSSTEFTAATIEETELYNADGVTVTATGFDAEASYGPEIQIRVTNDSDRTVDITAEDVEVNGFMMDPGLLYVVASPGGMADSEITLYNFVLDANGIDTVAAVTLSIVVSDDETYEEIGRSDRMTLTTSAAEGFTQTVDDSGDVLYDADGIRVVCQGLKEDDVWDGDLVIYAENNTDLYVGVTCEDVSVNGQPQENVSFWADLQPGTRNVTGMYLMDLEDLELENVEDVEEISFRLQIIDQDAWEELDVSEQITLTFG